MTTSNLFTLKRTFNAPRELVWQVWTQADHLGNWFSPETFSIKVMKMDLKPNGIFHYCMKTPEGMEIWAKWVFRDINSPETLEWMQSFSNADGGVDGHAMVPVWPKYTLSRMTLKELGYKTELLLESQSYEASTEEIAVFKEAFDDMTKGWGSTFDNLENYLERMQ